MDIRDDENVTVLGDPLLMRRATSMPAPDSVDVEVLFVEQRRRLVNLAAAITLDRSVAEEVVQDAFAGLQHRASDVADPVGYLHRSVVNHAISVIRRRGTAARYVVPAKRLFSDFWLIE